MSFPWSANASAILSVHICSQKHVHANFWYTYKNILPCFTAFITYFLLMGSLQKWLEVMKVFHRNINWIDRDTLFPRGVEEVYEKDVKSGYRERQSGGVFKEMLDVPKIQKIWNIQRYSYIYHWQSKFATTCGTCCHMITTESKILWQLGVSMTKTLNHQVKKKLMETTGLKIIIPVAARLSKVFLEWFEAPEDTSKHWIDG